jgi:hypothetical protein
MSLVRRVQARFRSPRLSPAHPIITPKEPQTQMDAPYEKLARVVQAVESGRLDLDVDEIYAHGPYTWQESDHTELAVIIVYEPPDEDIVTWANRTRFHSLSEALCKITHYGTCQPDVLEFMRGGDRLAPALVRAPCNILQNAQVLAPLKLGLVWSALGDRDWMANVRRLQDRGVLEWKGDTLLVGTR